MRVNLWGKGHEAEVSSNGEVLTRPFNYSDLFFKNLDTVDIAFNFIKPVSGKQFIISGLAVSGNRDVGVNGSILVIYGTDSIASTTTTGKEIQLEVPKSTVLPFIQPNFLIAEGLFLNGKCDDNSVRVNIFGYFVPKVN